MIKTNSLTKSRRPFLSLRGECTVQAWSRQEAHRALHAYGESEVELMYLRNCPCEAEFFGWASLAFPENRLNKMRAAFGKPTYCNTLQVIRSSEVFREDQKMDPIDVANGKSLDAFIEEYLPER
jgi:hypothetical protein